MMLSPEAAQRAWITFGIGAILLALAGIQLWPLGWRTRWHRSRQPYRKREPFLFWSFIVPMMLAGAACIAMALTRLF